MNIIIIWNDDNLIPPPNSWISGSLWITSKDIFEETKFSNSFPIFVLAELAWGNRKQADFYGFEIIRKLRVVKKVMAPIVLLSFMPKTYFLREKGDFMHSILKTPGHYFTQLPAEFPLLLTDSYKGINQNTLQDINNHFFSNEGFLDEEFHDLKNKVIRVEGSNSPEVFYQQVENAINRAFGRISVALQLPNPQILTKIEDNILSDLKNKIVQEQNANDCISIINNYAGEVKRLLPANPQNPSELNIENIPVWKVLFVDDDVEITTKVKQLFDTKQIRCEVANNAHSAFDLLKADTNNEIVVLISDYRMLNEDRSWQPIQGYDILESAFLEYQNQLSFFALTSFSKRTILNIQKNHKMRIWVYTKEDVIGGVNNAGFNVFVEKVLEEGNKVFDYFRSQPKAMAWVNGYDKKFDRPLRDYYKRHRLASDYELANQLITQKSNSVFEAILKAKHQSIASGYLDIPSMQENIGKDKKTPQTEEEKLERFRERLLGRRIAIALYALLDMEKGQIFHTMKRNALTMKLPQESDNTINQYFTTYLALSLEKDVPDISILEEKRIVSNLLPEEINWLKNLIASNGE